MTAQNALRDYPFARPERREAFSIIILRAKYHLAKNSVEEKRVERYRDTIDEYYAFENDFPESEHMKEARAILKSAESEVKKKNLDVVRD